MLIVRRNSPVFGMDTLKAWAPPPVPKRGASNAMKGSSCD